MWLWIKYNRNINKIIHSFVYNAAINFYEVKKHVRKIKTVFENIYWAVKLQDNVFNSMVFGVDVLSEKVNMVPKTEH